jgi:uncharacterized protein YkwD
MLYQARAEAPGGDRPSLVWDGGLAQGAQEWADTMAANNDFNHSGAADVGENLSFFGGVSGEVFQASAQQWVDEKSNYHGEVIGETGPGGDYNAWGHYTQVR